MLLCICITEACGDPNPINNGKVVISGRIPGSNATYSCNDRYRLVGNATLLCQPDSQWLGEVPKCKGSVKVYPCMHVMTCIYSVSMYFKGSVQWKNDLGLYCSLVLVMNIGMCDLVILCLVYPPQEL